MLAEREPDVLWSPDPRHGGPLARFTTWAGRIGGVAAPDHAALHDWSGQDLDSF